MTFDDLLREHGPSLWRVIASYAPPGAERADLAQDVLVAVWQALPHFRGQGSARSFVLRIAHNRGLSAAWKRPKPTPSGVELRDLPDVHICIMVYI
jgi:RNA polymerase sigma factor (sigma-70 family)